MQFTLNALFTMINASFDVLVLYVLRYYVDSYCESIAIIQYVLFVFRKFIKNFKCSTILVPYQISSITSYASLNAHVTLNTGISLFLRIFIFIFMISNPYLIFITQKIIYLADTVGVLVFAYCVVELAQIPGIYFQYSLRDAQFVALPLFCIALYYLYFCDILSKIIGILIVAAQIIISDRGSIISSLILIIMVTSQTPILYLITQIAIIAYITLRNHPIEKISIGLIISSSFYHDSLFTHTMILIGYVIRQFQLKKQKSC